MVRTAATTERLLAADAHYLQCNLCEHRCNTDRRAGVLGRCKASDQARVFRHRVEYGEEPQLVPSHLFYLSGCDLRCAFCIAEEKAFNPRIGTLLTSEFLGQAIEWGKARGARNVQWVGGEPTIHLPAVLRAMSACRDMPPVVWKSDFYATPEVFDLLDGAVDVFVADFKFGNDNCAERIARVPNYVATLERNLVLADRRADLIVRHLLLPGHFDCCFRPIVDWMERELPHVKFSLRDGYLPKWQARQFSELAGRLDSSAARQARELAVERGLMLVG